MFPSHWSHHISIAVILNFATLISFFAVPIPSQYPVRLIMIYPGTVVLNIMACRLFRNLKFSCYSQVLIMPTKINIENPTQHDCIPGTGGENTYHTGDIVNMPISVEVSGWKEFVRLHIPESHRQDIERQNTHLGGVEVTKIIELTRS
jgi:hypothetical protein